MCSPSICSRNGGPEATALRKILPTPPCRYSAQDGSTVRDAVVVLKTPNLAGDRLTFDVQVLEGDLTGTDGAAAVFIDIIGLPWTPLSYAGVARRTCASGGLVFSGSRTLLSSILPALPVRPAPMRVLSLPALLLGTTKRAFQPQLTENLR